LPSVGLPIKVVDSFHRPPPFALMHRASTCQFTFPTSSSPSPNLRYFFSFGWCALTPLVVMIRSSAPNITPRSLAASSPVCHPCSPLSQSPFFSLLWPLRHSTDSFRSAQSVHDFRQCLSFLCHPTILFLLCFFLGICFGRGRLSFRGTGDLLSFLFPAIVGVLGSFFLCVCPFFSVGRAMHVSPEGIETLVMMTTTPIRPASLRWFPRYRFPIIPQLMLPSGVNFLAPFVLVRGFQLAFLTTFDLSGTTLSPLPVSIPRSYPVFFARASHVLLYCLFPPPLPCFRNTFRFFDEPIRLASASSLFGVSLFVFPLRRTFSFTYHCS